MKEYSLLAKGELPSFLKSYNTRYFIPEREPWIKGIKEDNKSFYLDIIYSSNSIVFGDEVTSYCNKLLREYIKTDIKIYLVRSNEVATFSDNRNIFITTGLICRLTNEAQLLFYLVRELEVLKREKDPLFEKVIRKTSLSYAIKELSKFPLEFNMELDQNALNLIIEKGLYQKSEVQSSLNILKYQHRPFYEYPFDIAYFNSDKSYIPVSEYFIFRKANPKTYNYELEFPELKKRIEHIGGAEIQIDNKTYLVDKSSFLKIVTICRLESVRINLLQANFANSIYEIYVAEKLGVVSKDLQILKAAAWWGLVNQSVGNINPKKYTPYESSDSEGALLILYLRSKSKLAKLSMALRILQDIRVEYPESQAVQRMFEDLIEISAGMEEFIIENFHAKGLKESIHDNNPSLEGEENALLEIEAQALRSKGIDSINYYYYLIPDLVNDKKFVTIYNTYKGDSAQISERQLNSIAFVDFDMRRYKQKNIKKIEHKNKTVSESIHTAQSKTGLQINSVEVTTDSSYNLSYLMNSLIIQNYWYNNNQKTFHSVFSDDLVQLSNHLETDALGVFIYEHAFEPRYKPFHLIGLAVVTLPYIIPEIFFSGNRTIASSLVIDPTTGETIQLTNRRYRDPYSSLLVQQAFLDEITRLSYD